MKELTPTKNIAFRLFSELVESYHLFFFFFFFSFFRKSGCPVALGGHSFACSFFRGVVFQILSNS